MHIEENQTSTRINSFMLLIVAAIISCTPGNSDEENLDTRPNILLIVADDLGFTDLGAFGGEISTPNIDRLANQGMLFTNYHTSPVCAVTRAMLLSGNDNHIAGMGRQSADSVLRKNWGYEKHLSNRIVPLPQLMRDAGYHTYTTGKWHLGDDEENSALAKGFERSWNLLYGAGNHYNNVGLSNTLPISQYRENGKLVEYPEGRYSTEFYTSTLIEFIKQDKDDSDPFFAFAAFTSPHWPLQAPEQFRDKYKGKYDSGYDELRQNRFNAVKEKGIIPKNAMLPPRLEDIPLWSELSADEKRIESKRMELYAAMVDNLDFHVGRLIDSLKAFDLYENTLVILVSDNGAAGEDFYNNVNPDYREFLHSAYENTFENMGTEHSFVVYRRPWAHAGSAPFNRYKGFTTEGGIRVPLIVSGKGVGKTNVIDHSYLTLLDLAPTFYELAGIQYPGNYVSDNILPLLGESMFSLISGKEQVVHDDDYVTVLEHSGRAYVRKGTWKLVQIDRPFHEDDFVMFNLDSDLGETTDLKVENPNKYQELLQLYRDYANRVQVISN